ncbi:MAG: rod shape-determining protein MreC [Thermodesulfobacteria bacterium]|nr:rod shape-determining protein MreC [Thermodesulfobacteriota bacterium]
MTLVFGGLGGEKKLSYGERLNLKLLGPWSEKASEGGFGLRSLWRKYLWLVGVAEENERLRREILQLQAELARLKEKEKAYERLARLLKVSSFVEGEVVEAQIIGKPLGSWQAMVVINKGIKDGVLPEMPVLSAAPRKGAALVGQVVAAEDHYAKVLLLLDPSSAVDVLVQRSRQRGILRGQGKDVCLLDYVPAEADVRENDLVITSGFDGVYPKGILVGTVKRIYPGRLKGLFRPIEVEPAVDFESLEEVVVLQKKPKK